MVDDKHPLFNKGRRTECIVLYFSSSLNVFGSDFIYVCNKSGVVPKCKPELFVL